MAKTITGNALKKLVEDGIIIEGGALENCGPLKYDFVLSDEFLKSEFKAPRKIADLTAMERRNVVIKPGEVVYVLTKETIHIPANMYMSLSANRGMSEYGILTLGGFAVDPGYSGKLMFGLYNYSSTDFTLIPGEKLVGAVFYQFDEDEAANIELLNTPKPITKFPPRLVSIIDQYSPVGLASLDDSIQVIKEQIEALKQELSRNKDEMSELRRLVQDTQEQTNRMSRSIYEMSNKVSELSDTVKNLRTAIGEVSENLGREISLRKTALEEMDKKLALTAEEVNGKIKFMKGAAWASTALVTVLGTLFITWVAGMLHF